jgi:hypothetical protein
MRVMKRWIPNRGRTEHVNVVRHGLKLDGLGQQPLGYLGHNLFRPGIDTIYQDLAAVPWTPYGWYWREWTALWLDRNLCSIT